MDRVFALRDSVLHRLDQNVGGRLLLALVREIAADDVIGMAAEMAYRFLFAVFPFLLLLITSLGFFGQAFGFEDIFGALLREVSPFLPPRVAEIIEQYLGHLLTSQSRTFLTIGILGTFWGAAGGIGTLIKGLNRAYDVTEPRPIWQRQLIALTVTLTLPPLALVLFFLTVVGRSGADWLNAVFGLGDEFVATLTLARWPVLFLLLLGGLALLYHFLPNVRHRFWWTLPGSLFAATGWFLITQAFSFYLNNFGNYDATYGSFGAVMAFLLWLYLVGVVILIGAEMNALLEPTQRKHWRAVHASAIRSERRPGEAPGHDEVAERPPPRPAARVAPDRSP